MKATSYNLCEHFYIGHMNQDAMQFEHIHAHIYRKKHKHRENYKRLQFLQGITKYIQH